MGVELMVAAVSLDDGREPDWEAAGCAIDDVRLATFWDTNEELYPWDFVGEEEVDPAPSVRSTWQTMERARTWLRLECASALPALRQPPAAAGYLELAGRSIWFAGGLTTGFSPDSRHFTALVHLIETGVAAAAGFEVFQQWWEKPRAARSLDRMSADARRRALAGEILAQLDAGLPSRIDESAWTPGEESVRSNLWVAMNGLISRDDCRRARARAIMELLDWSLALALRLNYLGPHGGDAPWLLDRCCDDIERGLQGPGPFRPGSLSRDTVDSIRQRLEALSTENPLDAETAKHRHHVSMRLIQWIAETLLHEAEEIGDEMAGVRLHPSPALRIRKPRKPVFPEFSGMEDGDSSVDDISWLVLSGVDWQATDDVLATLETGRRTELADDLAELRRIVERREFTRYAVENRLSDCSLWFTSGGAGDPTMAERIERLGRAGVLSIPGVLGWG